uniref:Secreted protein n=1 Tax=Zea mays TaxID=4577 RepID=A0A804QJD0_MAIZE
MTFVPTVVVPFATPLLMGSARATPTTPGFVQRHWRSHASPRLSQGVPLNAIHSALQADSFLALLSLMRLHACAFIISIIVCTLQRELREEACNKLPR